MEARVAFYCLVAKVDTALFKRDCMKVIGEWGGKRIFHFVKSKSSIPKSKRIQHITRIIGYCSHSFAQRAARKSVIAATE